MQTRLRGLTLLQVIGIIGIALAVVLYIAAKDREQKRAEQARIAKVKQESAERAARDARLKLEAEARKRANEESARLRAAQAEREAVADGVTRMTALAQRFFDVNRVAESTPRIALAQPVFALQSISRETQRLDVVACLRPAKAFMVAGMDDVVNGYIAFMQSHNQQLHLDNAKRNFESYKSRLGSCNL